MEDRKELASGRHRPHFAVQPFTQRVAGHVQIIIGLQSHPKLGRCAKVARQAQGGIGSDAPLAKHDFYVISITIDPFKAYPPLVVDKVRAFMPDALPPRSRHRQTAPQRL
jgi:hypothetical protein